MKSNPKNKKKPLPGNPVYPSREDIYSNEKKESFEENDPKLRNKKKTDEIDQGLDIPGAELDDADEMIGGEDEENNYYSLGGDAHEDLEEDKGD